MFKILIVDDENAIRRGLVHFVEWASVNCQVVGEAANGLDAIECINTTVPDILITDVKMPGMNGLELAKYIYDNHLPSKVIILTGYADFSYAQTALKYDVVDFVLKPTEPEQLLEAVDKAITLLMKEATDREKLTQLQNKILVYSDGIRESFLKELLEVSTSEASMVLQKEQELELFLENYHVLIFEIDPLKLDKVESDKARSNLKKLIDTVLADDCHYTIPLKSSQLCVITSVGTGHELMELCSEILGTLEGFHSCPTFIGISNPHHDILDLSIAYGEAASALSHRFYSRDHSCVFFYCPSMSQSEQERVALSNSALEDITTAVKNGDQARLSELILEVFEEMVHHHQPINDIKDTAIMLCSSLEALMLHHPRTSNLAQYTEEGVSIYKEILECSCASSLCELIIKTASNVSAALNAFEKQDNLIIAKATAYINQNYRNVLTLKTLADHVHTNSSYLSRLFKKETGDTVTEAINKVRLEKAKLLLTSTDLKTYEIAEQVGIPDPSYFSIIFKRYTGLSPKAYHRR